MDADSKLVKRIPRDAFERELFRQYIVSKLGDWSLNYVPLEVSVGEEPNSAGEWTIAISRLRNDVSLHFSAQPPISDTKITGTAWLAENPDADDHSLVVVMWRVPAQGDVRAQENDSRYAPRVEWEEE